MERLVPQSIGKLSQMTQEEADKRGYRFFMHSESKTSKQESQESLDSQTPISDSDTLKNRNTPSQ